MAKELSKDVEKENNQDEADRHDHDCCGADLKASVVISQTEHLLLVLSSKSSEKTTRFLVARVADVLATDYTLGACAGLCIVKKTLKVK